MSENCPDCLSPMEMADMGLWPCEHCKKASFHAECLDSTCKARELYLKAEESIVREKEGDGK